MTRSTRRAVLLGLGTISLAGCLSDSDEKPGDGTGVYDPGTGGNETTDGQNGSESGGENTDSLEDLAPVWTYEVGTWLDTAVDGVVYGREDFMHGSGGFVALEAETGDRLWAYGEANGYSSFTRPLVDDGLYAGYGDDAIGSGSGRLHALDLDGTERWTLDTGSVYHQPRLWNGTIYVGSDDGNVWAVDAESGDTVWSKSVDGEDDHPVDPRVEAVADGVVYVTKYGEFLAFEADTGDEQWHHDLGDDRVRTFHLADDGDGTTDPEAIYYSTYDAVGRLTNGESDWTTTLESAVAVHALEDDSLVVTFGYAIGVLDPADGNLRWSIEREEKGSLALTADGILLATDENEVSLRSLDGSERWTTPIENEIERLYPAQDALYVVTETGLVRLTRAGEIEATASIPDVRSLVVDDLVIVGAREKTYGLERSLE
ncbi:PQQ-like beta-propeller repeat protein [Natronosalvus halobius]|uniref:PQQ-like beta-propeller repeat protein n=1 Tax=Natronosalvus halobius TaxID=2953746 RepID=UPI0020A217CC|nr:PQQ-like beta-propeller repeat protein [Natronosalvus halobius]USZ71925.1 PQQ-like beta-propeller repeat protein [Natronosalvus halobius]